MVFTTWHELHLSECKGVKHSTSETKAEQVHTTANFTGL